MPGDGCKTVVLLALTFFLGFSSSVPAESAAEKSSVMAQGLKAMDAGDNQKAEDLFKQVIAESGNLKEYGHYYYAQLLTKLQRVPEAKKQYLAILELSPNQKLMMETNFSLAAIDISEKNFKQARALLAAPASSSRPSTATTSSLRNTAPGTATSTRAGISCGW